MALWCVVPAAGKGLRVGGDLPKQYLPLSGRTVMQCTLDRLCQLPVEAVIVPVAADDTRAATLEYRDAALLRFVPGGAERADSVLAGARIVEMADAPMVQATRGLIAGLTVVLWAFATWLIPALVAAGWWRHVARRLPLGYDATLWSIVFPLGMYGVAGIYLGQADQLPVVGMVGRVELWVAFGAWLVVLVAMLRHLWLSVVVGGGSRRDENPADVAG